MSNTHRQKDTVIAACPQIALVAIPLIGALSCITSASAQIVPSSSGTSTAVSNTESGYDISGGQLSEYEENLFHGFEQFNLSAGQTANFLASPSVRNVIGSIEGGTASTINGTLQVSGSSANLYLINPAGILFGPAAQLNLSGGMTATTADVLGFENGQLVVGANSDYSSLTDSPTSFLFTNAGAGAVINLGNLQVDSNQFISLIGGTVVNTGSLEAPEGTVSIGAAEAGNIIRLSQKEHLLSLELITDETITSSGLEISPVGISEMLTGSGLSGATALFTDADGTVRLGSTNEAVVQRGGEAVVLGTLSTAGKPGGNVNVLGKRLSLETATLDASGDANSTAGEPRLRGLIQIDADDIVITDKAIPTDFGTTTYLSSGYVEGLSSNGDLDIAASGDFTIEELSDGDLTFQKGSSVVLTADSNQNLEGAFVMQALPNPSTSTNIQTISAERGRIAISGAGITAGAIRTDTIGSRREGGGDITLTSSKGVDVYSISSNTYSPANNAGNGGNVRVEAGSEGIAIRKEIKTGSYSGDGNNAGDGGSIDLRANGDIAVGELLSVSTADRNSAGSGGPISIDSTAGNVTVTGDIRSGSQAGKNNASAGGSVTIAANNIDVQGTIDTSSTASNTNAEDAGSVSLTADGSVLVRAVNATSSQEDRDGDILLTGDRIDLLGGEDSVSGGYLWLRPSSKSQDINIGASSDMEETLDISTTDLAAIKTAQSVAIGDPEGTGNVSLSSSNIEATDSAFPVRILGGNALIGPNTDSVWTIDGTDTGSINNFLFENISNLVGGEEDDIFLFEEDGVLSGSVDGGEGFDTIDFTNSQSNEANFSRIEKIIDRERESVSEEIPNQEALNISEIKRTAALSNREANDSGSIEVDIAKSLRANGTEALSIADTFNQIELGTGEAFRDYLGVSGESEETETIDSVQQRLREVEAATGEVPALLYAYFVPSTEPEGFAVTGSDRPEQSDDQLEVMMITQDGEPIRRRQRNVTREQIEAASRTLRREITSQFSTERQYLPPAQQLYNWILRPIAQDLENRGVESIGFVMDDGLRTMPIAALHNGDRYLVQDYSLGILPNVSLTKFKSEDSERDNFKAARVLAMGASEFNNQPPLPAVGVEIDLVTQHLWQGDAFLNEDFVIENLQKKLAQQDYGIVHLATHASFESGDLKNSYIQMWDGRLSLNDMKTLGLDNSDVNLIILSACNTALGDRQSEYGFAGFAITAGSESALASLWPVSDEGTLGFMSQFYEELKQSPIKAEALRQAQLSLLSGNVGIEDGFIYDLGDEIIAHLPALDESGRWDFSHPFYWSAFTMIGSPW